ncbi:hypothetical protein ORJ04_19005 [Rheinheimera baltica]|uniref:Methylamine utilization protein MauD n=1 Tax=Rheinheimera baltica TaxID=67576 RepID=A0ABT9I3S7_9GAMM|nr:hypothetical protein [Rheinheimera baltica]MDP5138042.1 hypothetical protein [Rheinheimera baltica]MDP5150041.1 hypothetical protein [Rheinheimera baltica]
MTEVQLLSALVCCLALLLGLNLKLTYALYQRVRYLPGFTRVPEPLAIGTALPVVLGKALLNAEVSPVWQHGRPTALLLLASRCAKCKTKLSELPELLLLASGAGLEIKLITNESARPYRRFLAHAELASHCLMVRQSDYVQLNPQQMSPAYLFIDQQGQVEATGLIGDENWQLLCEQLKGFTDVEQSVA